ncbi:type IX secretion system membrane protein PorP/SprF [Spirosoma montaniterrae]|uniref:Type IX secretion system membrane protein PorP/SprF n=1 Tax=Spirosoma montaniterrae TaxID=1178516 RepID=A0A1P9WRF4_9BACT|nr:type IX secretion system membrane protein PorP/SprF [Spirosoma montaniterrae]AQG77955.1 hypothetical protein AWR27_00465 [Spirosoma montaniterrae]
MTRTLYVATSFLMVFAHTALAQQDPQLSLYMYNPIYYNPAAAGSEGVSRVQITHRSQYLGYQTNVGDPGGGQNTQVVSFNMPLNGIKSGIGVYAMNDVFGPSINQSVQLSYAYRLTLKSGVLAFGVQAGMFNRGYDFGQFRPGEPGDPTIPTGRINQFRPDLGAGVYYNTTDYWIGISSMHLNGATYNYIADRSTEGANGKTYLTAGYRLGLTYDIDIQPSLLLAYSAREGIRGSTATANLLATYANRIWAGAGYRFGDAIMITGGINLMRNNALRVGYALDLVAGGASTKSATSHEFLLAYALPTSDGRKKPIVRTPRFRY